ncbi:MAG: NHL repeat-containing protein [Nitrospirae bacterium]|nr:NHL repeat-containing protein [Nitrospirota bacterium]
MLSRIFRYLSVANPSAILIIFLVSSFFLTGTAHAIKLTRVRHLFDISYNFSQPSDVAVSYNGLIYVVDGVNNKIKVFDHSGTYLYSFGRKGSRSGEFDFPMGIGIDNSGNVYIADSGNNRVQIFKSDGGFITEVEITSNDGITSDPTDVSVDESRGVFYVVDNNNHCILVYDLKTLKKINSYGVPGTEKLEFRYPFLMTLDNEKYLYVVDVINTRVQVLNPEGLFVEFIGAWGVEKGEFFRPKGIAIDSNKRIYVSDSYMGVIQVFDERGTFYSVIGDSTGKAVKKFKTPTGLFIDKNNRLYVVEMFGEKVSVFKLEDENETDDAEVKPDTR